MPTPIFDINCTQCPRLAAFLEQVRSKHPDYHARPVAPFGDPAARLLIVGLAPGYHGANASGRPFTGDYAGILLYETLYEFGFASAPESRHKDDGLELHNCRISNAVKCLPPQNKPTGDEINTCNPFIKNEIESLAPGSVLLALGGIAHNAVLKTLGYKLSPYKFGHGAEHRLGELTMVDSYHCSRYNTQTRRLTPAMFKQVFARVKQLLDD